MKSPSTKRTMAAIYREAAREKELEPDVYQGSCQHIIDVCHRRGIEWPPVLRAYREAFGKAGHVFWWPDGDADSRVLALCFMAAMVEAGDA